MTYLRPGCLAVTSEHDSCSRGTEPVLVLEGLGLEFIIEVSLPMGVNASDRHCGVQLIGRGVVEAVAVIVISCK